MSHTKTSSIAEEMYQLAWLVSYFLLGPQLQQPAIGWPAGTKEAQKEKIMTATSDDELTVEESGIADDRVYEIFDAFSPDTQEYKDLVFLLTSAFEILQRWENKGHSVR